MKISNYFLLIIFSFGSLQLNAQRLSPNENLFDLSDYLFDYQSGVRNNLIQNLTAQPLLRLTVLPSFESEYVFQIEETEKNKFTAVVNISEENLWESKNPKTVKVNQFKSEIKKEDVQILYDSYKKLLRNTYFSSSNPIGHDGVFYYFSIWEPDYLTGNIWSPKDRATAKIIEISERISSDIINKNKSVGLKNEEKEFLNNFISAKNKSTEIQDLELVQRLIGCINEYQEIYSAKLPEITRNSFERTIAEFKREIFLSLASDSFSKEELGNSLNRYENQIKKLIDIHRNNPTVHVTDKDVENFKNDNLFQKLKDEIRSF